MQQKHHRRFSKGGAKVGIKKTPLKRGAETPRIPQLFRNFSADTPRALQKFRVNYFILARQKSSGERLNLS